MAFMEHGFGGDEPLPLDQLRGRVSTKTFSWLEQAEIEERTRLEALKHDEALTSAASLFAHNEDEEDWSEATKRVQEWKSSSTNPDGVGGYDERNEVIRGKARKEVEDGTTVVRVKYVLSEASGGHGETIWAAARHAANLFANAEKCRELLGSLLTDGEVGSNKLKGLQHPLLGLRLLELGAGGGIPSWTAMRCGAKVVCTDQSIPERIQCLAESAERNRRDMVDMLELEDKALLAYADAVRVCPYDWGTPVGDVTSSNAKFDIVLAADCIYMPSFHDVLLESIKMLMSKKGVALLPFALHGNTKDNKVWAITKLAKEKGFDVEVLEPQQLTPQISNMDVKRGLVHNIRLTFGQI